MKIEIKTMKTQSQLDAVKKFLDRNGHAVPEGLEDSVKSPSGQHFFVIARNEVKDVVALAEITPFYAEIEPDDVMHVERTYLENDIDDAGHRKRFIGKVLDVCYERDIPAVVLTGGGTTRLAQYGSLGFEARHFGDLYYVIKALRDDWPFPTLVPRTDGEPF